MKKLALFIVLVAALFCHKASAQAVVANQCNGTSFANTTTTCSYGSNITAGHVLLVFGSGNAGAFTGTISGCGLTWTQAKQDATNGYVKAYALVTSTTSCTLTLTESSTPAGSMKLNGFELSGVTTPTDCQAYSTSTGGTAAYNTPSCTTTSSGDLVIASLQMVSNNAPGTITVNSPFTAVTISADVNGALAYDVQSSAGAINATFNFASYGTFALETTAFPNSTPAVGTPTASIAAGTYTYSLPLSVTLTSVTSGATLCYTTNGTTPAATTPGTCSTGSTLTNGSSITVSVSQTVQVLGTKSGDTNSSVASFSYVISPTFAKWNNVSVGQVKGGISTIDSKTIGQTTGNYNGWNTLTPCPNFYPVDFIITGNGVTQGTAVTTSNLATMTLGTYTAWTQAATHQTVGATQGPIPANVGINGTTGLTCITPTQSLAQDNTFAGGNPEISIATFTTSATIAVISGFMTPGPLNGTVGQTGSLFDAVVILGNTALYAVVQLDSGSSGLSCGNIYAYTIETGPTSVTHSGCITVTSQVRIWYTMKFDMTSNKLASLNIYAVNGRTFTQIGSTVTIALANTDTLSQIWVGNHEAGTSAGQTTYIEDLMVDYTNHVFPNIPH